MQKTARGFAAMDREKQREIARKGGKAAHEKGTAHQFSSDEAREAGRKGGISVSQDREHMATIGREGGQRRNHNRVEPNVTRDTRRTAWPVNYAPQSEA